MYTALTVKAGRSRAGDKSSSERSRSRFMRHESSATQTLVLIPFVTTSQRLQFNGHQSAACCALTLTFHEVIVLELNSVWRVIDY